MSGHQPDDGPTPNELTIIYLEADLEVASGKLKRIESIVEKAPDLELADFSKDDVIGMAKALNDIWDILQPDESGEQI